MAIYTCTTPEGALSAEQRAVIAAEITRIHTAHTGDRPSMVWVIFATAASDSIYAGGRPAANAVIVGLFRESRSTEDKARVLNELWSMYTSVTGLSDDQLWVSLTEIAANDAMMFGAILPEPGHEAAWLAQLGRSDLDRAPSPKQASA
jgi:phenylpyruvate tautomerase PptA (4-oxalocrotonate tautomerase family)